MRETVHKIMSLNNEVIPYKDWTTTVREARARQSPTDLQEKLRNYFEKAVKRPQISNMLRHDAELFGKHDQRKSHEKIARKTVLGHVSRNRPHPTIFFPFQTGDRLKTYMVWIPQDTQKLHKMLPLVPRERNTTSTTLPRNNPGIRRRLCTSEQSTALDLTTQQHEADKRPFLHRNVNMVDHFPSIKIKNNHRAPKDRLKAR
ncbi:uncharacterized protein LOC141879624 [Acropora palmata]